MNGRSMFVGMAVGLAGLLGGCEKDEMWIRDECRVGSLTMKAQYHQVSGAFDVCNILLYNGDHIVGFIVDPRNNAVIYCDDGRTFDASACAFFKRL